MRLLLLLLAWAGVAAASASDIHSKALTPIVEKTPPAGGAMAFVKGGVCDFSIVGAEKGTKAARAAKILADCFEKATGSAPGKGRYAITLAPSDDPKDQLVSVRTSPGGVTLGGNVLYSAIDFAERFLGVRWYYPGEGGTIHPKIADLVIRPIWYEDRPWFEGERGTFYYPQQSVYTAARRAHWVPYLGELTVKDATEFGAFYRIEGRGCTGGAHNPRPDLMAKAHPDKLRTIFYTSPSGKFWYNPGGHVGNYFNVLDLKFADLLVEDWKAYFASGGKENRGGFDFAATPGSRISFGVCDTYMPLSEVRDDPVVKALGLIKDSDLARDPDAAMCNVYARFYQYLGERLKAELPGHPLFLLIYYNTKVASLDPRFKLPDNVELNVCDGRLPGKTRNPAEMEKTVRLFREWYEANGSRPALKAWLYASRFDHFGRAIRPEFIGDVPKLLGKYLSRQGGLFYDYDGGQDLWHYFYSVYAGYKSQWNPDFDVDAAIDEMMTDLYGEKAGRWLRKFHRELKAAYVKYDVLGTGRTTVYPPEVIDSFETSLKEAEKLLAPGTVEMKRFRLLADFWPETFKTQRVLASYVPPAYAVARHSADLDWSKVAAMPLLVTKTGEPAKVPGAIRLAWDEKGLYGRFEADVAPKADASRDMWVNDSLELFLCPGLGKEVLYQFAFDCLDRSHASKQRFEPIPQPPDSAFKGEGFAHESEVGARGWSSRFFIPWSVFEAAAPKAGERWNANFVRNAMGAVVESSGSALTLGVNNARAMFSILEFQ